MRPILRGTLLGVALIGGAFIGPVAAQPKVATFGAGIDASSTEAEPLLVALRLRDLVLTDAMPALLQGSVLLLPLGELAQALEFDIKVDAAAGRANGWFLREDRLISLDLRLGQVIIEGKESTFDTRLARVADNDIYVDIRLLARWFPIDLSYDISELKIVVTPREPLPIDERLRRESYRHRLLFRRDDRSGYAHYDLPYRGFSIPVFDVSTEFSVDRSNGPPQADVTYSALATGDLLWMNSEIFLNGGDGDGVSDLRVKLERKDPAGQMLGSLQATEIGIGDILAPQIPLVANSRLGRGAILSNVPLDTPDEFDRITLQGNLPLGWEAELYRNGILLAFQSATADGRYRFVDVPLVFGVNILRLVFYGPQGQRREEIRQVRVGTEQLRPGNLRYRFAFNEPDESLVPNMGSDISTTSEGQDLALANVMVGATDWLTLGANMATVPTATGQKSYAGSTGIFALGDSLWRADGVKDLDGGHAARMSVQTSLFGYSLFGEHGRFHQFESDEIRASGESQLETRTRARVEGILDFGSAVQVPLSLAGEYNTYEDDQRELRLSNRLSGSYGLTSLSNILTWERSDFAGDRTESLLGSLLVTGPLDGFRIRGQANYSVDPDLSVTGTALTFERRLTPRTQVQFGIDRSFVAPVVTTLSAGLNARLDSTYLGVRFEYDDNDDFMALFSLSFSIGYDPVSRRIWRSSDRSAGYGNFVGRVFLDQDGDGAFDEDAGDRPLQGARLRVEGRSYTETTNADGMIMLRGLPPYVETAIGVDSATLGDPFLVAQKPGIIVVPRPGAANTYDFTVRTTGEIDGTVFRVDGEAAMPVSGAIIQLVGKDGTLLREVRSAYDGLYLFDFVPPGDYVVRIDQKQLDGLDIQLQQERKLHIGGDGSVVDQQDLVVVPANPAVPGQPEGEETSGLSEPK